MELAEQKQQFYTGVYPSHPNEWEVDEIFERLADLDYTTREALLSHVGAIWPVSHSLCFSYLTEGVRALEILPVDLLPEWVREILGLYEKKGLLGARQFMADVDKSFLGPLRGESGVTFDEISARMTHYIRGVSGRLLELGVSPVPTTDTRTIFLPELLATFSEKRHNSLLYKLLVTLQWGHIESRLFAEILGPDLIARDIFSRFPDGKLAEDIFSLLQFRKIFHRLEGELPGLIRQSRKLCIQLCKDIDLKGKATEKSAAFQLLFTESLSCGEDIGAFGLDYRGKVNGAENSLGLSEILDLLPNLYNKFSGMPGSYDLGAASMLLGEFNFTRSGEIIALQRKKDKDRFIATLALMMDKQSGRSNEDVQTGNVPEELGENLLLLLAKRHERNRQGKKDAIQMDNDGLELPEELAALINEIELDLGNLPEAYVQAAAGLGGGGFNRQENKIVEESVSFAEKGTHSYDEWDFRRGGYRSNWCSLHEKSIHLVRSNFVASTLEKYSSQMSRLRRQFEMLRTQNRFVKRRRHGDDIDLDALIDALGDSRAGLTPSDRLFVRLLRDERDIGAMFLIDMSNSTEGWVGVAVKEALVLLAEALEVVGDQYGIYGFSGMRRSKSELFHIKHFEEPYDTEVKQRIGSITPKEYTRMGPPIRHLTKKLLETQSKVRLLVVISDGKPEDYDDYKGQYAIEDTRKALLEARGCGIYPFCITIDKSAHEYLTHMFGKGNYIFIDNIFSLPAKITEMYRLLTS